MNTVRRNSQTRAKCPCRSWRNHSKQREHNNKVYNYISRWCNIGSKSIIPKPGLVSPLEVLCSVARPALAARVLCLDTSSRHGHKQTSTDHIIRPALIALFVVTVLVWCFDIRLSLHCSKAQISVSECFPHLLASHHPPPWRQLCIIGPDFMGSMVIRGHVP